MRKQDLIESRAFQEAGDEAKFFSCRFLIEELDFSVAVSQLR